MDRRLFLCLTALCFAAITTATDEDPKETENIECKQDGFLPHPTNCRAYYWCSLRRRVRAIILECEENEIFDTQSQKCTYPNLSSRKECGGTKHLTDAFGIKPRIERSPDAQLRNLPNGCSKEEFVGDENDCSKFYRCVNNGGGQFAKYEFSCAPGTVWDSDISSCNHAWAVKSKCGNGLINSSPSQNYPPKGEYEQYPVGEPPYPIKNPDPYPIYQQQLPQGMQNPDYGDYKPIPPQSQGYNPSSQYPQNEYKPNPYPEQPPKETKPIEQPSKPNEPEESYYNPNPIYERPQGGYEPSNEYNFQQQPNQEISSSPAPTSPEPQQPSSSDKGEESSKAPPVIDNEINPDSTECQAEGFVPDSNDCKKFYRCVENGKRRFIKYEFTCGQSTVWDPQINACNHEWAVKKNNCKYKIDQANNEASEKPSSSVNQYGNETTEQGNGNKDEKPSNKEPVGEGGSTSQAPPTHEYGSSTSTDGPNTSTTTTEQNIYTITTEQNNSITTEKNPSTNEEKEHQEISYECTKEGFIPDKNDCKKFYRCVPNEKGGFIKYEFSCGEGTVWDPDANTCNFPGATRNKCGKGTESSSSNSTRPIDTESTTTEKGPVSVDSSGNTNPTTTQQSSSGSNENGSANTTTTSENNPGNTNNTASNSTEEDKHQLKGECRNEEDYIPDKHDCKKFYRCVKSSKDGFTKYEFSCGQGTVWDPDAKTCNYPWATRNKCGTGQESGSTDSSSNNSSNENGSSNTSGVSTSEAPVSVTDNNEQGSSNSCPDGKYCETTSGSSTNSPNSENHTEKAPTEIVESTGQNNTSTTEEKPNQPSNTSSVAQYDNCVSDGEFIGDSKNCKKFYRCVGNEKGGFTKYEFTCGEGTVWDSIVNTCNHPSAVKGNCSNKNVDSEEASTSEAPAAAQNGTSVEEKENVLTTEKATEPPEITSVSETSSTESGNKETQSEVSSTQPPSTEQSSASESTTIGSSSSSNTQQPSTGDSSEQSPATDSTTETSSTEPGNKETSTQLPYTEGSSEQSPATDTTTEASSSESGNKETSSQQPSTGDSSEQSPTTETTTASTNKVTNSTLTDNKPTSTEKNPTETSPASQEGPTSEKTNKCTKEGFFPNMEHCNKFYRCVSNGMGGYTKYDFDCGGGTIWDPDLDTCNHPYAVTNKKCEQGNQQQQSKGDCTTEGYFASNKDCKNFYRCVDNGNGQYVKYDFKCDNNTVWDPNTLSCNHPWVTVNKVCGHRGDNIPPTATPEKETKPEPPKETSSATPPTTEVLNNTTEQEIIVTTVANQQTTVDTTTESQTETPDKEVTQGQTTENQKEITDISSQPSEQTTTTEKSTTPLVNIPETTTLIEETTTEKESTASGITESTGVTDSSSEPTASSSESTDSSSSTDSSPDSSSIEPSTSTDSSSVDTSTSTDSPSSTETASTDSSSSTETASTDLSSSTETASTDSYSSTETASTDSSSSTETASTDSSSSTETASTDSSSSTETASTESSSTETASTESPSTETASTESPSTETASSSYTETVSTDSSSSTETASTDSSSPVTDSSSESPQTVTALPQEANQTATCPISQLEGDQMALVCPTGFKRHPKYCNLFYQCTSNPDTFDINVLVISCPGRRIYDDLKIQCLPPDESDQECTGQMAEKEQLRKFGNSVTPMEMESEEPLCPNVGNLPLHPSECNNHFIKCEKASSNLMRGFMYVCPENYSYWPVSKKCERLSPALPCEADPEQKKIWQIPVEIEMDPIDVRFRA